MIENKNKILPKEFVEDMRQTYGEEVATRLADALCNTAPTTSIRVNEAKLNGIDGCGTAGLLDNLERVPWCSSGYYLDERPAFTFDPLLHAGAYYVQEASSMFIEQIVRQWLLSEDSIVSGSQMVALDLCAAPGGKSTLLRSLLPEGALLVCNEPVAKRAQVLAENMTKWGHPDVVVTQSMPSDFTPLTDMFDVILTDVPCSGEGMFRKDDGAIADWSPANVELCRNRQREILRDVWPALRPGGLLIYSTCTFNRHEDEDNVQWVADELGAEILECSLSPCPSPVACARASSEGRGDKKHWHFLPGYVRGEGFYAAALRKMGGEERVARGVEAVEGERAVYEKLSEGGVEYALRKEHVAILRQLRMFTKVLQAGVTLGVHDKRKGSFVPAHAVALSMGELNAGYERVEIDYDQGVRYLRGESLVLPAGTPKGYVIVCFKGLPLGFVKNIGSRANNLYPDAWRIRSSHVTRFTVAKNKG